MDGFIAQESTESRLRKIAASYAEVPDQQHAERALIEAAGPDGAALLARSGARLFLAEARTAARAKLVESARIEVARQEFPAHVLAAAAGRVNAMVDYFAWPLPVTGKPLGDATAEDLQQAALVHERQVKAHRTRAAQYRTLADLLARAGAPTVRRGLTQEQVRDVLAREAA